jgi:hypothetical protein
MTDNEQQRYPEVLERPLPTLVTVSQAFASRIPSQRVQDALSRVEGGSFADIAQASPFRLVAFRALVRDYPTYDVNALWLHSYDVEVEVAEPDPTQNGNTTTSPPFAVTTE